MTRLLSMLQVLLVATWNPWLHGCVLKCNREWGCEQPVSVEKQASSRQVVVAWTQAQRAPETLLGEAKRTHELLCPVSVG